MNKLIKKLTLIREAFMLDNGIKVGLVKPINEEMYNRLKNYFFAGLPLNIQVKYVRPNISGGKCDIRARFLMFAFDEAILVKGNHGVIQTLSENEDGEHWWVEDETSVYDPTSLLAYDKDFYYRLNHVKNVEKFRREELLEDPYIKRINDSSLEDLLPQGKSRFDLLESIPLLEYPFCSNPDLAKYLEEFKHLVSYDYGEIMKELKVSLNIK